MFGNTIQDETTGDLPPFGRELVVLADGVTLLVNDLGTRAVPLEPDTAIDTTRILLAKDATRGDKPDTVLYQR